MLTVNYPPQYQDESSRTNKKFKYYKIEPLDLFPKKEERPKEIKIGKTSGRISTLENWRKYPEQGNINHFKKLTESLFAESFEDLIENYDTNINSKSS